jgi:hypothetical protein
LLPGPIRLAAALAVLFAIGTDARAVIVRDHTNPCTAGTAFRFDVVPIFELPVALTTGVAVTYETRNASEGADPVLHLLAPVGSGGPVTEVAWDDDGAGNRNARLAFTPQASATYLLVMRATWNRRGGTAEVYKDGQRIWTPLPAGGAFKRIEGLRPGESLVSLSLPKGPRLHVAYVVDEEGHLRERYTTGANEAIVRTVTFPRAVEILMVAPVWPDVASPIRLVRNDAALDGHDPDHDGIGVEVEGNIGTCSSLTGLAVDWDCSRSTDSRDTDGDGLSDGLELLGILDRQPYQHLARWGADPRHKDLFLEVDFMMRSRDEHFRRLSRDAALDMAQTYADRETEPLLRLYHAQSLGNPDLQPGVRLHLDTGETPHADKDEWEHATYGDWGGVSVVQPVCDGDDCRGADAQDVWKSQMHEIRHGIFHYGLAYAGSGGQAPYHKVAFNLPMLDPGRAAHELAHNFGLAHNGPEDDNRLDANCKPNYPSIMSYAYLDKGWRGFSDGYGRPPMNNSRLTEQGAVAGASGSPGRRLLEALRDYFGYNVDLAAGHVDWNRDGVFSPATVGAYSNNNGSGCEMTRNNVVPIRGRSQRAPALTRVGNMTLAFYINESMSLEFAYTLDSLACPQGAPQGCGPPMILRYVDLPWNRGLQAFDAHRVRRGGELVALIVYRDIQGRLFEVFFSRSNLGWTTPRRIATAYPAIEDVSLAGDDSTTVLAYRTGDGTALFKTRDPAGAWSADAVIRDPGGGPIRIAPGSSPALLFTPTPSASRTLFGLFPVWEQGFLRLYSYDPATRRWTPSPWQPEDEPSFGRPALAWAPVAPGSPMPGRIYLLWMNRSPEAKNTVRETMLTAVMDPPAVRFGFRSDHDNSWFFGYGVDLLFEPGVDTNLRSLIAVKPYKEGVLQPPRIELRPKADGVVNMDLRDWNDWEVLGVDLCRTLVDSGSSGIHCPDWRW